MMIRDEEPGPASIPGRDDNIGPAFTFGPVPSRRFGRSLGLNTILPKTCSYSCIYCQVGKTEHLTIGRRRHADSGMLLAEVRGMLDRLRSRGEQVDYLTFVSDGEPTLDLGLGEQLRLLKPLGTRLAVITNGSLLTDESLCRALDVADRVSVKVDAVRHRSWRCMNRPHGRLSLQQILDGVLRFRKQFRGEMDTETMLIDGVNDSSDDLRPLAAFLERAAPDCAYIGIPTRPSAVASTRPASEEAIVQAYGLFSSVLPRVELLTAFEGTDFAYSGDARADLLATTAVHPMRSDQVEALLQRCSASWDVVEWLVRQEQLREVSYGGQAFYLRRLSR